MTAAVRFSALILITASEGRVGACPKGKRSRCYPCLSVGFSGRTCLPTAMRAQATIAAVRLHLTRSRRPAPVNYFLPQGSSFSRDNHMFLLGVRADSERVALR